LSDYQREFGDRLKRAVKLAGGPEAISGKLKVAASTLYTYFKGGQSPTVRLAYDIQNESGVRPEWLFLGLPPEVEGGEAGDWETSSGAPPVKFLPYYDITVSAGNGVEPLEGEPEKTFAFRLDWLRSRFSDLDALALVRVEGDSMMPELRPKDLLMVDKSQNVARDGIFVVQIGTQLLVKRVQQIAATKVKLLSANPVYGPIDIDLTDKDNPFTIIAKAVWLGRNI